MSTQPLAAYISAVKALRAIAALPHENSDTKTLLAARRARDAAHRQLVAHVGNNVAQTLIRMSVK